MSVIQLVRKVIKIEVEVIVGLGKIIVTDNEWDHRVHHTEYILTSYCVEFMRAISARMFVVDSWNGGGELR